MSNAALNRFEWLKAVTQDGDVTAVAKVVATALSLQYANDETGQINPSIATLAKYISVSTNTIKRAIKILIKAGWLGRTEGRGRGNKTQFILFSPANFKPIPATRKGCKSALLKTEKGADLSGKGRKPAPLHYKDKQSLNKRVVGHNERPTLLTAVVEIGSWQEEAWNKWLIQRDLPKLELLGRSITNARKGGYDMPWSSPPLDGDEIAVNIAKNLILWAINRMNDE